MSKRFESIQELLAEALEITDPLERAKFLEIACGANRDLRREVEELLQAESDAGQFLLAKPADGAAQAVIVEALHGGDFGVQSAERKGDRIGRYKVVRKIGEGGCGVVYMAEQETPVRRKVALKVIKLGMDTRQVVARFEAERQALALMDHPNIARVLDAGATESGRPFFVMELVSGIKITDYCDQNQLDTKERLELFIQVCRAVQHAHQKGVIHRDLKPSNILVTVHDGAPAPKIIDFGIAKATQGRLTDETFFTAFEQFVGTPAYMSPEQAAMTGVDIDTRSDIYSLGVLLYEMLTGKTPFDTRALLAGGLEDLRRTILETEPVRPSARLTGMGAEELFTTARQRGVEAPGLVHLVRGDLDWIVMNCLEKDRSRRYETANGLASDIRRYLNCEPVVARPPSRLYEFQKTVRRHKVGFFMTGAIIMALSAGVVVSALEVMRARRAEGEQVRLHQKAEREARNARLAAADAKEKLRSSLLAQAQAGRWSHQPGRRFRGLELLKEAAAIRPSLELRNEAIACMVLSDMRVLNEWQAFNEDTLVAFDADYQRYAFGDAQGTVHVRSVEEDRDLLLFSGYEVPFRDIQFSPDGHFLLLACGPLGNRVEILDLTLREAVLRLSEPHYRTASFTPDGQWVAIAYDLGNLNWPVRIFDLNSGLEAASFGHGSLPFILRFHPVDVNQLLTSDNTPTVRVWEWRKAQVVRSFEHSDRVQGIDWHPDGQTIASACLDNYVYLWEARTGQRRGMLPGHELSAVRVSFSADGEFLISFGWDGRLILWDVPAQREAARTHVSGGGYAFGRSRNAFAVYPATGRLGILEACASRGFSTLRRRPGAVSSVASCEFSPDGLSLLSAGKSGMHLWDLRRKLEAARVLKTEDFDHLAVFHPDGTNVFLATSSGVENWVLQKCGSDRESAFRLCRTIGPARAYNSITISRDGGTLAAGASDGLSLFDVPTGVEIHRLKPGQSETCSALSPDGQVAAIWARLGTNVQIWNVEQSRVIRDLPAGDVSIQVAFSPNNRLLVVGDGAQYRVWDRHTWRDLWLLPRTAASFWGRAVFSPDSALLAVAATRSTLKLVEANTGRELATLEAPERLNIGGLGFSSDGAQLAVATWPGPVQLWDLRAIRQQLASMHLDWDLPPYANCPSQERLRPMVELK